MNVVIDKIVDHGHDDERIVLRVVAADDIGNYLVLDTTYSGDGGVSNKVRHPYWFPDQEVGEGDRVVLYTKKGTQYSKTNKDGTTTYIFYWGLDSNVWNNDGDCALLLHIDAWMHHRVTIQK